MGLTSRSAALGSLALLALAAVGHPVAAMPPAPVRYDKLAEGVQASLPSEEMLFASAEGMLTGERFLAGLVRAKDGRWRMALHGNDAAELWRKEVTGALDRVPFPDRGEIRFEVLGDRGLFDFSIPLDESSRRARLLLGFGVGTPPRVLFEGVTGAEEGEYGTRVELTDLRGDGTRHLVASGIGDAPVLCDGTPARVHPRIYDWKSGELKTVSITPSADGLALLDAKSDAAEALPAVTTMTFVAASSTPGDGGSVRAVAPPRALGDGDTRTAWIEGEPRFGPGAFVIARTGSARLIRAVRIVPGHGAGDKEWKGHNRLKEAILVLGNGLTGTRWLVRFPDSRKPTAMTVTLPEPAAAPCVALIIRDVHPGRDRTRTAISELAVLTDLDTTTLAERVTLLVKEVSSGGARSTASTAALAATGSAGVEAILMALKSETDPAARARLLRVLPRVDTTAALLAVEATILALGSGSEEERAAAREALAVRGEAVIGAVSAATLDPVRRPEALKTLALMGQTVAPARGELVLLLGRADEPWRAEVESAMASVGAPIWPDVTKLLSDLPADTPDAIRLAVVRLVAGLPVPAETGLPESTPGTALERLSGWSTPDSSFPMRYFASKALARFPAKMAVDALSLVALKDPDEVIRERAVISLAEHSGERPGEVIVAKLKDDDARVRGAALRTVAEATAKVPALGGRAMDAVASLLENDPWPHLRSKAAWVLAEMGASSPLTPRAEAALIDSLADSSIAVAASAMEALAAVKSDRGRDAMIELLADEDWGAKRRAASAVALANMGARSAVKTLLSVLRRHRLLSTGSPHAEKLARACAFALGRLGDRSARVPLEDCVVDGRTDPVRDACAFALGELGDPCARVLLVDARDNAPDKKTRAMAARSLAKLKDAGVCTAKK